MKLEFVSKHPHRSRNLVIMHNKNEDATPIVEAMKAIGWEVVKNSLPPIRGIQEICLSRKGSDIFNSWTTAEHKAFIKEAEKALKTVGHKNVPYRKLTIQDCI